MVLGPQLRLLLVYHHLQVALIAHQDQLRIRGSAFRQLEPLGRHVREGFGSAEVEHQHHSVAPFEVGRHDRPVAFLACRVPDVEFYRLPFYCDFFYFEVYRGHRRCLFGEELPLDVLPEKSCFAHVGVAYHDQLVPQLAARGKISLLNHYIVPNAANTNS